MDPRLIPGLHPYPKIAGQRINTSDHCVLRLPGQIAVVKIEYVVVLDSPVGGLSRRTVPDCLEKAPGRQMALFQGEGWQAGKERGVSLDFSSASGLGR